MTKRNVGGALLALVVSVTAAIASCSFPSYEIIVTGTAGSTGGASATSSSGTVGGNGGESSTVTTSSGTGGSSASTSSASSTGSGVPCVGDGGPCDCDDDKVLATSCGTGGDCNDHDPLVFPGQLKFFKDKIAGSASDYDYDCSGKDEYESSTVINCVGLNCNTMVMGWSVAAPACGASGKFGTCKVTGLATCAEDIKGMQVQKCH